MPSISEFASNVSGLISRALRIITNPDSAINNNNFKTQVTRAASQYFSEDSQKRSYRAYQEQSRKSQSASQSFSRGSSSVGTPENNTTPTDLFTANNILAITSPADHALKLKKEKQKEFDQEKKAYQKELSQKRKEQIKQKEILNNAGKKQPSESPTIHKGKAPKDDIPQPSSLRLIDEDIHEVTKNPRLAKYKSDVDTILDDCMESLQKKQTYEAPKEDTPPVALVRLISKTLEEAAVNKHFTDDFFPIIDDWISSLDKTSEQLVERNPRLKNFAEDVGYMVDNYMFSIQRKPTPIKFADTVKSRMLWNKDGSSILETESQHTKIDHPLAEEQTKYQKENPAKKCAGANTLKRRSYIKESILKKTSPLVISLE
jgi:hypothetical protein